jgi:hypothetical protein
LTREFCFARLHFGLRVVILALSYRPIVRGVLKNERSRAATDTPCGCTRRFRRSFPRRVRSEATQAFDQNTHAQEDQTRRRYPGRIHLRIGANVDELDHGALIAGPTSLCGLVAVTGTTPIGAAIVLLLHVTSNFQRESSAPA